MKHKKYLSTAFFAILLLPLLSANAKAPKVEGFDIKSIVFVEEEPQVDFDTKAYLPQGFDPYEGTIAIEAVNFIEEDEIELGFDTLKYLPEDFNPYKK